MIAEAVRISRGFLAIRLARLNHADANTFSLRYLGMVAGQDVAETKQAVRDLPVYELGPALDALVHKEKTGDWPCRTTAKETQQRP